MAAVLARKHIGIRDIGFTVTVADDPGARLMYYLDSMCTVLDLKSQGNIARLRNHKTYAGLTEEEIDQLVIICGLLAPSKLDGIVIFANAEMCGDRQNAFYEISAVQRNFVLTESIMIGGQTCRVTKVMFYTSRWLLDYWLIPMKSFERRLARIARGEPPQRRPAAVNYQDRRAVITDPTPSLPQSPYLPRPKAKPCCYCVIL